MLQGPPGAGRLGRQQQGRAASHPPHPSAVTKPPPAADHRQVQSGPSQPLNPPLRSTDRRGSVCLVGTGKINGAGAAGGGTITWPDKVIHRESNLLSSSMDLGLVGGGLKPVVRFCCPAALLFPPLLRPPLVSFTFLQRGGLERSPWSPTCSIQL